MKKCPKCNNITLQSRPIKGRRVEVDYCHQCKGVWFEDGELGELLGRRPGDHIDIPSYARATASCACPECGDDLVEFCYPGTMTLVDACRRCYGFWLDDQELQLIYKYERDQALGPKMRCPKCHHEQTVRAQCEKCGVIFSKLEQQATDRADAEMETHTEQPGYADNIPGIKGRLLRFIDRSITRLWAGIRDRD